MERMREDKELLAMPTVVIQGETIGVGNGAIHAAEATLERQDELLETAQRHLVTVDPSLPCGCIDGRSCEHTLAGNETQPRPSVAGGVTTAYAAAEMVGWFAEDEGLTPVERFEQVRRTLAAAQIPTGNHVDKGHVENNFSDGGTGCGASDKLVANVSNTYDFADGVEGFVKALSGASYRDDLALARQPKDAVLAALEGWNPVAAKDVLATNDPESVEVLASDTTETKGHREFTVLFNFVEGTTIDRDAFVAETGEQMFVVDMWYIDKLARAMARGPHAEEQYLELRQAMIAYQIGTYLSLCDGSQTYNLLQEAA